jgi:hypothetical protein
MAAKARARQPALAYSHQHEQTNPLSRCLSTARTLCLHHTLAHARAPFLPRLLAPLLTHTRAGPTGVVVRVIDRYVGEVEMLDDGDVVRVDQTHCETVLPVRWCARETDSCGG